MVETKQSFALEKRLQDLYDAHTERSKLIEWNYYDYLPWEKGSSFTLNPWNESQRTLPTEIVTAIETSMLTEINLPWYTAYLKDMFRDGLAPLQGFVHNWVAEEDQHATALENYLVLTRNSDPNELGVLKSEMMVTGWDSTFASPIATMGYTAIQELATVVFYQKIAKSSKEHDETLSVLLTRLSKDESLHYAFYNQVIQIYLELDPNQIVFLAPIILDFKMPGQVLKDFDARMKIIEKAGYGPEQYLDGVLEVLVKRWKIESIQPSTEEGRNAKRDVLVFMDKLRRLKAFANRRKK
mgnify:FL=1